MKNAFLCIISILVCNFAQAQNQPKIKDYPFGSLDVAVMVLPFGMEHPIKIGHMSKSGDIKFDILKELPQLSKEMEDNFMNDVAYTLFDVCDTTMVAGNENIKSVETGALSLWTTDKRYVGVIFTVSDEELLPWIEDPGYNEPILGSYFELIYVASSFKYKGECTQTRMLDDGDAEIRFSYDIDLKSGFNFIEYKIDHIYKTDPNVMASFPDKILVSNVEDIPNCKWIGKYF
ncbi:hypothetical protein [Winogradskyella sp.]|uniref:hypothetical protein n=1 Tax=Winogradskyella sp. TaxID=1883156 RepID=UPI003AB32749